MAVTLSGVLKDPYGKPLPGATIRFDAVRTSATVLNHIRAEAITDAQGDYSISVEVGRYDVRVMQGRSFLELAKNLEVRAHSTAANLNDLVVEWQGESDVTPGIIIEFRALTDEARGYRDEAGASADAAAASESNAASSASSASESASNAATSKQNASGSATAASASAASASESADAASTSEENAAGSASAAATSESNAATSASNAASSASAAATSKSNAAGSASAAAASESNAAQSATDAAASAASIDAADLVHAPGSGLPNEAGDIYSRNTAEFDAAGSAASAEQAAKGYAVQRSHHTGTQLLNTISDAGTAAAANLGTGANDVLKTSQADARYARLSGPNEFDTMPSIGGSPIIESDSNDDGHWTRWADGTQICRNYKEAGLGANRGGLIYLGATEFITQMAAAFVNTDYQVSVNCSRKGGSGGDTAYNY
ncbi:prophage tail fiber N-terminal domain-containing protein [Halomonas sp. DP5Y7-2]|uniref:prophage tail fiber N-terminal domain-containing protein n=1 Tax=Halomonas sp. DP5Y7-2 TaxID=2859076 RepID=UPI001C99E88C|nr:prophage tail fiber N-terminal domain-containing protein [Halomonas sp. DP5Y7-2]MBY5984467.1 prophage tail fiber N-terminal domain-containing protein [Halomonas sp. DP5Y7-2]